MKWNTLKVHATMMFVYTLRRTRERVMETGEHRARGRDRDQETDCTVVDSEERVNLYISIRSGTLFTLEMTALSVILKPQ